MSEASALQTVLARLGTLPQVTPIEGRPARRLTAPEASAETILHALLAEIDTAMLAVRLVVAAGDQGPRLELWAATRRLRGFETAEAAADALRVFAEAATAAQTPLAVLAETSERSDDGAGLTGRALAEALDLTAEDPNAAPADRFLKRAAPVLRAAVIRRGDAQEALGAAQDIPETEAGLAAILDGPWSQFAAQSDTSRDDPALISWLSAEDPEEGDAPAIAISHWPSERNNGTDCLAILAFDPGDAARLHGAFAKAL